MVKRTNLLDGFIRLSNSSGFTTIISKIGGSIEAQFIVIVYHRIGPQKFEWALPSLPEKIFEGHLDYLSQNFRIVSLDWMIKNIENRDIKNGRYVAITFDDGYKDNLEFAAPILSRRSIPATLFLTTDYIGSGSLTWWDELAFAYSEINTKKKIYDTNHILDDRMVSPVDYNFKSIALLKSCSNAEKKTFIANILGILESKTPKEYGNQLMLNWNDVRELHSIGIEIGSHTASHPIMTKISLEAAKEEIIQSKKKIEKEIDNPVIKFAYPNGLKADFNKDIIKLLQINGFECGMTTIPHINKINSARFSLGRIGGGIKGNDSLIFNASGLYSYIYRMMRLGRND